MSADLAQRRGSMQSAVIIGLMFFLSMFAGCAAVMTGTSGSSAGRPVGSDSRSSSQASQDARISTIVRSRFGRDPDLAPARLQVVTNRGVVTLKGAVADFALRDRAVNLASDVEGVVRVRNELVIR